MTNPGRKPVRRLRQRATLWKSPPKFLAIEVCKAHEGRACELGSGGAEIPPLRRNYSTEFARTELGKFNILAPGVLRCISAVTGDRGFL